MFALDTEDEALRKYKESLIGKLENLNIDKNAKAKLDVLKLTILCEADNIQNEYDFSNLKDTVIRIKEDVEFSIVLDIRVSNDLLVGLRYSHVAKKAGLELDTVTEIIGSYSPLKEVQKLNIKHLHAPKGILGRGEYNISAALTDDDNVCHKEWNWILKVSKTWVKDK